MIEMNKTITKDGALRWTNIEEDFWKKVFKTENCWLWQGTKKSHGLDRLGLPRIYGYFSFNGKKWEAHRFSFI